MTPEQFLSTHFYPNKPIDWGDVNFTQQEVIEAMRLYGQHVAKEVRHKAAEIALTEESENAHRMIMNIQINDK